MNPEPRSAVGGRRELAVLFADISGFTAMSEKLDPEDVTTLMNRCFGILEGIVIAHDGTVSTYIGDCLMATFGETGKREDASRGAVEAALEIRKTIGDLNRELELPDTLGVHFGIDSGTVIAGEIGGAVQREFSVTGSTVNLAARLRDMSGEGQILVGPGTHSDTRDEFEYRELSSLRAPDGEESVPIYEFLHLKPRQRRIEREGERRQATVLFADLLGFKALSETMTAEAVTELLNRCFAVLEETVRNHGGIVDKYVGESAMALFGVPTAIEHAPQQAINAAIELRNRLAQFNTEEQLAVPLNVRIGVNTGLVVAGEIGGRLKRDFTVMGDAVNVASRLKDACVMGAIYVGPETYRYTRNAFEYRTLAPLQLKGKAEPVAVNEVLSVKERLHRVRADTSDRTISSPLVGRERELGQLREHLLQLVAGRGGIVSLIAEAGLGKTRLVSELLGEEIVKGVTALEGRCSSIGQNLSFHPFVDLLRNWAKITEDETEQEALSKLERAVTELIADEKQEVVPFIAILMGLRLVGASAERIGGMDGEALERLIFKGIRELFQAMARAQPVLLVLEDLHWADQSSIRLLEALLRLTTDRALLFLAVFRPDYQETAERIVATALEQHREKYVEIRLEPLDRSQSVSLVENLLKIEDLPHTTRQLIIQKAEGNPFFIEEVVRSLIDHGAIVWEDNHFRVTEGIESVEIPGTIEEVVMARVDRLDEPTRRVLQAGSVIGRSFYHSIIAEILRRQGQLDELVEQGLATLKERQLLIERTTRWSVTVGRRSMLQELEYLFKHALAQQTIYESLLLKTRKELHRNVALTIETLFADRLDDFYGMLAYHYSQAEEIEKAEDYLFKAGEEAARSAASAEALNCFREASRLYFLIHGEGGDPHKKAMLEKNIGLALLNRGSLTESIEHFDRALQCLGERVSATAAGMHFRFGFDLLSVLWHLYLPTSVGRLQLPRRSPPDDERQVFEIVYNRSKAQTTSDPRRLFFDSIAGVRRLNRTDPRGIHQACGIFAGTGALFAFSGISFGISRRFIGFAGKLLRDGNPRDLFVYSSMRFVENYLEGNWGEDVSIGRELLEEALRNGQFWDVNTYLGLNCDRKLRQGDFVAAREHLAKLTEMIEAYGYEFAESNHDGMLAILLLEQRRLEDALRAVDEYYAARHEDTLRVLALGTRTKIQVLMNDCEGASTTLNKVREIVNRSGIMPTWHLSAYALGQLWYDVQVLENALAGSPSSVRVALRRQARKSARYALSIVSKVAVQRTEAYGLCGTLCWLLGKRRRARAWWEKSIAEGKRLGARPELARTYTEVARRLSETGRGSRALAGRKAPHYSEEARILFIEMGLEWDLARLQGSAADST